MASSRGISIQNVLPKETVLVTPTVIKLFPLPAVRIIGDLSEEDAVLGALGLPQKEKP